MRVCWYSVANKDFKNSSLDIERGRERERESNEDAAKGTTWKELYQSVIS